MKHPALIFLPSGKTIVVIVLLNVILFGAVGSGVYYHSNFSNLEYHQYKNIETIDGTTLQYFNTIYTIGRSVYYENISSTQNPDNYSINSIYYLQVTDKSGIQNIPLLNFTLFHELQFQRDDEVGISVRLLTNAGNILFLLIQKTMVDLKAPSGDNNARISGRMQYLMALNMGVNDGVFSIIDSMRMYNITNKDFLLGDMAYRSIGSNSDNLAMVLTDYTNSSFSNYPQRSNYLYNSSTTESLVITDRIIPKIKNDLKTTELNSMLSFKPGTYQDELTPNIDNIQELSLPDLMIPTNDTHTVSYPIDYLKGSKIQFIDSNYRIHITGTVYNESNFIIDDFDQLSYNYVREVNTPDYVVIDPSTNSSHYWDLIPFYRFDNQIKLTLLSDGSIFGVFDGANWNFTGYNPYSNNFNSSIYYEWKGIYHLQYFVFDPIHPTLENYYQYNPNISKTNQSTVRYPRITTRDMGYYYWMPNYELMSRRLSDSKSEVYMATTLFHTKSGINSTLHIKMDESIGITSPVYDRSLVLFRFEIRGVDDYHLIEHTIISGPDRIIPSVIDENFLKNKLDGFSIMKIHFITLGVSNDQINPLISDVNSTRILYTADFKKLGFKEHMPLVVEQVSFAEVF